MTETLWKSIRWRSCLGPEDAFDSDWGRSLPFWDIRWDSLSEATRQQWADWNPVAWAGTHGTPVTGGPAKWELLELTDSEGKSWAIEVWNRPRLRLLDPDGHYQTLDLLMDSALAHTPGGAWEWDATTDGPEIPCIFLPLEKVTCPYPQAEIDHLIDQDELAPLAVAALERAIFLANEDPWTLPDDYCLAIHLATLLGIWKDPRAFRPLADLLEHDDSTVYAVFGDFTCEFLPRVLAATAGDQTGLLVEVIEHRGGEMFHRLAALDALTILAKEGTLPGFPEWLAKWMESPPSLGDDDTPDWPEMIATKAVDLRLTQYRDLIHRITTASPRRIRFIDWEWAEKNLRQPPDNNEIPPSDCRLIPARLAEWHCFSEKARDEQPQRDVLGAEYPAFEAPDDWVTEPLERTTPKIGRNEPCPCGSGKKYKKCCGG